MATARNPLSFDEVNPATAEAVHEYHAEASVLEADLMQPIEEKIAPRVKVKLPKDGHYQFKHADPFRVEGILSYKTGYTQVAGHPSSKSDGFATLTTSVLEDVNVLDVVTADRVVAQISTVHPKYGTGQVPSVTFLGTRFDNLRIGGHKVEIVPALKIVGTRSADDTSYFDDPEVKNRFAQQYETISTHPELTDEVRRFFPKGGQPWLQKNGNVSSMSCSLIDNVKGIDQAHGSPFGHVIDVPHFGRIYLGELKINREAGNPAKQVNDKYTFELTMIRLEMGCLAKGTAKVAMADSNGTGKGSPPPPTP